MATTDDKLSRLFDGELPLSEAESLRRELGETERAKLAALSALSQTVRDAVRTEADGYDLDVWSAIEDRIEADVPNVVPLRRKIFLRTTAAFSALALAAAMVLVFRPTAPRPSNCEILELEVVGSGATVMKVPDEHGNETTLIWFDHQEEDEWESL